MRDVSVFCRYCLFFSPLFSLYMADLQRAIEIAVLAHKGQFQKNGMPYVAHPLALMQAVSSIEAKIAAVLHDVVEDTDWTLEALRAEGFSVDVLEAIDCLTHRVADAYADYIERIRENELAREVKLADLQDNMNIRRLPKLQKKDLVRLEKYHMAWLRLKTSSA
jgi:(p)ppGpp synthase/HD superfamily hydrolase